MAGTRRTMRPRKRGFASQWPLALILLAMDPAAAEPIAMTRDESLINAFQVMCFLGDPVYDSLDAKAAAMRMKSLNDRPPAGPPGVTVKGHIWGGSLKTGPFVLHLSEQSLNAGVASSCGVSGSVPDAETFRADMLRVMKLPPLPAAPPGADGSLASIWNDMPRPNHRLILRSVAGANGAATVMMTYSVKGTR